MSKKAIDKINEYLSEIQGNNKRDNDLNELGFSTSSLSNLNTKMKELKSDLLKPIKSDLNANNI
jgi:hypothetical protein